MDKIRDSSIDISKGLAILFVYLGHSIIYNPIDLCQIEPRFLVLNSFITSFNMPMFFLISGYLFAKSNKSKRDLYKGKLMRIAIPYLTTMAIVVVAKLYLPTTMSYNPAARGGVKLMLQNVLLYGGDRWFVYTLFLIFVFAIPLRNCLKNKWIALILIVASITIYYLNIMPTIFKLDEVVHYVSFFIVGMCMADYYLEFKQWCLRYWIPIFIVFIFANIIFVRTLLPFFIVYKYLLAFSGTIAVMTLAFWLEKIIERNRATQYIEYLGKYSLQFYLFTFCYPVIRTIIVSVMHVTNPFIIFLSVFILQLITTTIIVEITRRIKYLKIPCGY